MLAAMKLFAPKSIEVSREKKSSFSLETVMIFDLIKTDSAPMKRLN